MPHFWSRHHGDGHGHGHHGLAGSLASSMTSSPASSRPSSRPPSPTRMNTRLSTASGATGSSSIPISPVSSTFQGRSREATLDSLLTGGSAAGSLSTGQGGTTTTTGAATTTTGGDYFGSVEHTPAQSPATSYVPGYSADMWRDGTTTPGGYFNHAPPVEIILDSENLVLRGMGQEMNPAYLSGRVELNLHEDTNIKEVNLMLVGKAKVQWNEPGGGRSHHHTHPFLHHDWSFLAGARHSHTLKAGHHSWPFTLMLEGSLPSSLTTYNGEASISYKLRATVVRSGFTASKWNAFKTFTLHRTYTSDALEFNQTLEIENTWPGKIMYALTLPFKAYAAGDEIPVAVKFMPLAKGVRVISVTSVLKEYTQVHSKHSSHPDSRVASSVKHEFRDGRAVLADSEPIRPPMHHSLSHANVMNSHHGSAGPSRPSSPTQGGTVLTNRYLPAGTSRATIAATSAQRASVSAASAAGPSGSSGPSASSASGPSTSTSAADAVTGDANGDEEDIEIGDDEINASITIPVPNFTTPTHVIHPVFVTHKIKWSCSIANPDGHISELRCALPIIILDHSVLEEARTNGAATRALLFGGEVEEVQQVDLPSYSAHVYDRVAADSGTTAGYVARSSQNTPLPSPMRETPPHSRTPSRPGSPTHRDRDLPSELDEEGHPIVAGDVPPRPALSEWADSELLLSLGALRVHSQGSSPHDTPPESRGSSRPLSRRGSRSGLSSLMGSRPGSRPNSRPGSRASSPDRHSGHERPGNERRGSGLNLSARLHLPGALKPLRTVTPAGSSSNSILRNSSAANLMSYGSSSGGGGNDGGIQRNASSFTNLATATANSHVSFGGETRHHFPANPNAEPEVPAISRVPNYEVARTGFAGALDVRPPAYEASERAVGHDSNSIEGGLPRPRSDTALVALGAAAAAEAEERAADEAE